MRSKGRNIEKNSGARVSVLAVIALVFLSMIIAIPASADLIDNSTAGDPDLIVSVESYDPITGDLWVAVSSDPETPHNIFSNLQVTITIDGNEVDSHIEPSIEGHYYYPVPLSTLPEGDDHEVKVTIDYSWKTGKKDPNTSNNVAIQSFVVGPQTVQQNMYLQNCQVIVGGDGNIRASGTTMPTDARDWVVTISGEGITGTQAFGQGSADFCRVIFVPGPGTYTAKFAIAPTPESGIEDPDLNDYVLVDFIIPEPAPVQDLAVISITNNTASKTFDVKVCDMDSVSGLDGSNIIYLTVNGITESQPVAGTANPSTISFAKNLFPLPPGTTQSAKAWVVSDVTDLVLTNNEAYLDVVIPAIPDPEPDTQDLALTVTSPCENGKVDVGITRIDSGDIEEATLQIQREGEDWTDIEYFGISAVGPISRTVDLSYAGATPGDYNVKIRVVSPIQDPDESNNGETVSFTIIAPEDPDPEDPAPSFDINLFKLEEVTPIQLKGTIKFEGGTLPESAAVYVNDMRIGDSFTDNGDGTFSFLVTPQRYASGTDFKISVLSFVAEENMDNNHQLWTAPSSAIVIEQANAYYCGGDTKVRSLTTVTGNALSSAAYHISIYDKDGKCIVNDKVIGGPSKIPVGTAYRYMNIQKYVNDLDAGAYQAKLWVLDKSGLKSNVYEFEIKIQKPQSKNLALTFAKFQCGSFKMGVGAKDGGVVPSDTIFTVTINGKTKVYSAGSDLSECLSYKQLQKDFGLCAGKVYSFKVTASSKKVCEAKKLLVDNTKTGTFKLKK